MFIEERDRCQFSWEDLGDIETGRPYLGLLVPVLVYRLLQYTLRDVLIQEFNVEKANELFLKRENWQENTSVKTFLIKACPSTNSSLNCRKL